MSRHRPSLRAALVAFAVAIGSGTLTGLAFGASGTTIVVSRSGPVKSLPQARDLARTSAHPVTIQVSDGTYRLSSPLALDSRDSGVTWTAAPGAHPVVSGAAKVTGWTLTDPAHGVWSAPL